MSGYFNTSPFGGGGRNNINNPKNKVDINSSNNLSVDILLQQLATAMQSTTNQGNNNQNNSESVAKLGIMLSQLTTNQQTANDFQQINIGGALDNEKRPLQKFFQADTTTSKRISYGSTAISWSNNKQPNSRNS